MHHDKCRNATEYPLLLLKIKSCIVPGGEEIVSTIQTWMQYQLATSQLASNFTTPKL